MRRVQLGALLLLSIAWLADGQTRAGQETAVQFSRDVRPILSDKCFKCHGPDKSARKADLRLDVAHAADEYLSPGEPEDSEVLRRITSDDDDERMPPVDSKLSLSAVEIATLRRWIAQGASYQEHWSFVPLKTVAVPDVNADSWPRNEIDHFILTRLRRQGVPPSREASREKLIRRVSFDLTGLPPTLEEIDAFLADTSDGAYERLVDRLLDKQAYGERMTSEWMDVARYSDSYGYQVDRDRHVWPWRDWVIKAFNKNLPYDQFVTLQLAGDLLPEATDDQILATTFNRLHPQKVEGGSTPEEFRVEYVADRTQTFGTALLGLSLQCARCHDHKYDPILQREYYQLFAFFNNIDEAGLYSYYTQSVPTPTLRLADEANKQQRTQLEAKIEGQEQALQATAAGRGGEFQKWLASRPSQTDLPGRIAAMDFEDFRGGANQSVPGYTGKGVKLTGDDGIGLKVGNFRRYQPFSVALWLNTPDVKKRAVVFHRSKAWTDAGSRGYQLLFEDGKLSASLIHFWPGNAIRVRTRDTIQPGKWFHVAFVYDGSSRAAGLKIYLDGQPAECEVVRDNLCKNITGGGGDNITIGQRSRDRGFAGGLVDEFQVYDRRLTPLEIAQLHDGRGIAEALSTPAEQWSDAQKSGLFEYYLATMDAEYQHRLSGLMEVRKQQCAAEDGIAEIMVMRELPQRRQTYLLKRGAYDAPAEPVKPLTPAVFPPFPQDQPRNRLGLARWLTDPGHPLTARVTVNRYWQMCFGEGFVRTPEDFGSQGQAPTHPQLLDWLARDFIQHGWDLKRLLKQIVTSATYRQTTGASAELRARDPDNRLLARGSSFRLPAEMIRDNALHVSGLLITRIGGPSAKPYEVTESFKPVERDKGAGLYRRSLYTYWKQTGPAPVMMALDAAKRDVCSVKRERTSSPIQAFILLNDPQFVEAARVLAQRMITRHGEDTSAITRELFRLMTSRTPSQREEQVLLEFYQQQLAEFERHEEKAQRFLKIGDAGRDAKLPAPRLATVALLASTLMNYDECVMKR